MRVVTMAMLGVLVACDGGASGVGADALTVPGGDDRERGIVELEASREAAPSEDAGALGDTVVASERPADSAVPPAAGEGGDPSGGATEGSDELPGKPGVEPLSPACATLCESVAGEVSKAACVGDVLGDWGYGLQDRCSEALAGQGGCGECLAESGVTSPDCIEAQLACEDAGETPLDPPGGTVDPQECAQQVCAAEINTCLSNEGCYYLFVCLQECTNENCQYDCLNDYDYETQELFFVVNDCLICSSCFGAVPENYCP